MRAAHTTCALVFLSLVLAPALKLNAEEIHEAVKAGDAARVQALLDAGAYVNSTPDDGFGWTPLHFAIAAGDTRIAEILLARGANLTARAFTRAYTDEYNAAIERAKYVQSVHDTPVVTPGMKFLYSGGHTPLEFAVAKKNIEMARLLLSKGADVNLANGGGWTPLHMAAEAGDSDMASLLLQNGANTDARDYRDLTPWDVAQPPTIDSVIVQRMDEAGIMGLGAAIIVDKKVVWMKGYGFADKARAVPFTPDTVMNIGSISKTFTGVALMSAVQEGKLSLDEDINAYLPFKVIHPHHPNEKITLRQLATHTSGITDRLSVYKETYHYDGGSPEPLGDFLKSYFSPGGSYYSKDNFLNVKPGTHREYSNIAAGLAGYIVEVAVGKKLNVYTKERIFNPLGMSNTGWFLSEIDPAKHAKLYVAQYGLTIPIPLYEGTVYPDGGVRTSVSDISRFFIALLDEGVHDGTRILDKRWVDEMLRFQYTESNKPENVSLQEINSGLFWASKRDVTLMGHAGTDPGVRTEMLANLAKDVGVILFTNTSLDGEEMRQFFGISDELWKYAKALKKAESLR